MKYKTSEIKDGKEIFISGSFTFRDHDTFFEIVALIKSNDSSIKRIVFNMENCDFIDSAGLGMLVIAHDEATARHIELVIKNAKGKTKEVLYAARFDTLYKFED